MERSINVENEVSPRKNILHGSHTARGLGARAKNTSRPMKLTNLKIKMPNEKSRHAEYR